MYKVVPQKADFFLNEEYIVILAARFGNKGDSLAKSTWLTPVRQASLADASQTGKPACFFS
jgi:hypothetical protein